jgi:hypothetical protein
MADGNFMANQKLLGNCAHGMEILLWAKIRRMATKHVDKMTELFSPLGRPPDLGSFFVSLF